MFIFFRFSLSFFSVVLCFVVVVSRRRSRRVALSFDKSDSDLYTQISVVERSKNPFEGEDSQCGQRRMMHYFHTKTTKRDIYAKKKMNINKQIFSPTSVLNERKCASMHTHGRALDKTIPFHKTTE